MGKNQPKRLEIKLPKSLQTSIRDGYIISIIQFGSSLRRVNYHDIDLAIVVKSGCYEKFVRKIYGKNFNGFDISLIKEEEVQGAKKFRFGSHGAHFLYSLINGKVLYGINPFRKYRVTKRQIKDSIIPPLYNYIEDVRRAIFEGKIKKSIKQRWPKFLRLSLYLIDPDLKYFEALNLREHKLKIYLNKYQIKVNIQPKRPENLLIAYETIWEEVLKKYKLLSSPKYSKKMVRFLSLTIS
ncbi:hypothetical protein J7K42_01760 [bacterium]|nr:hypothetical protein [bacterium]